MYVYIYRQESMGRGGGGGGGGIIWKSITYRQEVPYKVGLNDKVVRSTEHGPTQRMIGLQCAAFRVMSYTF
jgi:hypothetical protein